MTIVNHTAKFGNEIHDKSPNEAGTRGTGIKMDTTKVDGTGMVPVGKVDTGRKLGWWIVRVGCHRCPVVGTE